ncbi:MAG: diguanylate cyclase [Chloroflexi bacterium]|nr:diguanylate cyclase [Chloroflexota bacterium]
MLDFALDSKILRIREAVDWSLLLPRFKARRLGLRGEVLALYIASGLAILSVSAFFSARALTDGVHRQYTSAALAIWQVFDATYPSEEELRGPLVQDRLTRFQEGNPDVHEVRIYAQQDQRFQVVASSNPWVIGQSASLDDLTPVLQDQPVWREFSHQGTAIGELGAPLHARGRPSGVLAVHFRLSARDALVREGLLTLLLIAGSGGVLLLAALYWELERLVLKPLSFLQRHAAAIASGDLGARTQLRRKDEVGQLAQSFDHMAAALEQRQAENLRLQTELRERYEEAEQRAVHDPLTNLYNHRHFYERLNQELARARRFNQTVSVLFCDIDHFKRVNDAYGHQTGDLVLRTVAEALTEHLRDIDIVARYGGEEFAVILPSTGAEDAYEVAERARHQVAARAIHVPLRQVLPLDGSSHKSVTGDGSCKSQEDYCHEGDKTIAVTLSIGVASYPSDADLATDLVHDADLAMYHAKRLGRNQVQTHREVRDLELLDTGALGWVRDASYFEAVQSLAAAVDARDSYTHRHSSTVAHYATTLARSMGLSGAVLTQIHIAGLLHDVGKIGVPDHILGKPGPLTETEWAKMREHPEVGKGIVEHLSVHEHIVPLIVHHHERWDGGGYPHGLAGDSIPLGARIISVADAYHAMTSDRPYRPALSRAEALAVLQDEAGVQFDPRVVEAFIQISEEALLGPGDLAAGREDHHGNGTSHFP